MSNARRHTIGRALALVFVVSISVCIFLLPETQIKRLESYGYLGIFLLTLISNATVLLPAPGLIVVFSMGARLAPWGVGLAAGVGGALGELSGYLAGFSGQAIIANNRAYQRMVAWTNQYGFLAVLALAIIPNPLFDLTGIAAGALKMPLWEFLLWAWIGITIKMLIVALLGAGIFSIPWLQQWLIR